MRDAFLFKAENRAELGRPVPDESLTQALRSRLPFGRGPWRFRFLRKGKVVRPWSSWRRRRKAVRGAIYHLRRARVGDVMQIESRLGKRYRVRAVKLPELAGERVIAAVRSVMNPPAPYIFGTSNPPGPDGGLGVNFDCSGLVLWAVETATDGEVRLPHSSEWIRKDARVSLFRDERKCKPGDLVIMHFGRLPEGVADHIGVWESKGHMLDTRSPSKPVGRRPIEKANVMAYGRLEAVNGALRRK
jgi:cell wall-associated NlpC family hydrolase